MKLIVGLGNFGEKYEGTYHNMGFWVLDLLAKKMGVKFKKIQCKAQIAEGFIRGEKFVLAKPLTYMNLSGESVRELMGTFSAAPADLCVVFDDFDIGKGLLRLREAGSAGTHNGMRNIIDCIKTTEFFRVRVGIGKPEGEIDIADYVLSRISKAEYDLMLTAVDRASDACVDFLGGVSAPLIMQKYNNAGTN